MRLNTICYTAFVKGFAPGPWERQLVIKQNLTEEFTLRRILTFARLLHSFCFFPRKALQKAVQTLLRIMERPGTLFVLAMLLLATPSLGAQPVAIMEPDELRRGMRGYGLTTFQGTQIDTFGVEILGVMEGALGPRIDMILVRLSGEPLEHTGAIRGMSGSPIYIDGRLIGAFAYGWSDSKDPIGGITPISAMLEVARRPDAAAPQQYGQPVQLDAETTRQLGGQGVSVFQ